MLTWTRSRIELVSLGDASGVEWATHEYFQFSRDVREQRYHFFSLMHGFAFLLRRVQRPPYR